MRYKRKADGLWKLDWYEYCIREEFKSQSGDLIDRAAELCAALYAHFVASAALPPQPIPIDPQWPIDAKAVLSSTNFSLIIPGAHCAGYLRTVLPGGEAWLVELFRAGSVKARSMMLRYADRRKKPPEPGDAIDQIILLGIADRSGVVRDFAVEAAQRFGLARHIPALQSALSREPPKRREWFEQAISIMERGYWLGPADKYGLRLYRLESGLMSGVPAIAFDHLAEHEVMQRLARGVIRPGPDRDWYDQIHVEWMRIKPPPDTATIAHFAALNADNSDPAKRTALRERIKALQAAHAQAYPQTHGPNRAEDLPAVTIDEFFDGNAADGSICCNVDPQPKLTTIRKVLGKLAANPKVSAVRIQIHEAPEDSGWAYAEVVHVCTACTPDQIERTLKRLAPDTISPTKLPLPPGLDPAPAVHTWLSVWWD